MGLLVGFCFDDVIGSVWLVGLVVVGVWGVCGGGGGSFFFLFVLFGLVLFGWWLGVRLGVCPPTRLHDCWLAR
jgi:hypothetical protein